MKALIQRVSEADCVSEGKTTGAIEHGLLVFLGIRHTDTVQDIDYLVRKLTTLRLFSDDNRKFSKTVLDVNGSILLISQFTLYGSLRKGTKPEFSKAMDPEAAKSMYNLCIEQLRKHVTVAEGKFGSFMQISSVNEGPVSFILETDHLSHHE